MSIVIDKNREYLPSEVAENGFILSKWKRKSLRHIQRLCKTGKLKARSAVIVRKKTYLILGSDIIEYNLRKAEEKKLSKKPLVASV